MVYNSLLIPESEIKLQSLNEIPAYDCNFEVNLKKQDLAIMIFAGLAGALSSAALKNFCAEIHDHFGKKPTLRGGHSGEWIDVVPGNSMPGGFGHRWKFGHDLLNPFEINWTQYLKLAEESGTKLPLPVKACFFWLRHLFQDTFSTEGLPIPGHSVLRLFFNFSNPQVRSFFQVFGTIKTRDFVGAGVTNLLLRSYLQIRKERLNELSEASLFLGANSISLLMGLFLPGSLKSANLNSLPVIIHYSKKINQIQKKESKLLEKRGSFLSENEIILKKNHNLLMDSIEKSFENFKNINLAETLIESSEIAESYKKILNMKEASLCQIQ